MLIIMKGKSIFYSLWFNAVISVVAVVAIVTNAITQRYILLIVWIVIAYHFIKATKEKMPKK